MGEAINIKPKKAEMGQGQRGPVLSVAPAVNDQAQMKQKTEWKNTQDLSPSLPFAFQNGSTI